MGLNSDVFQTDGFKRDFNIGIVGGSGVTGAWFANALKKQGYNVLCASRSTELSPIAMAKQCKVVVISVPMDTTEKVIKDIGPHVPENGLMMDLTSVKIGPVRSMLEYSRSEVIGGHPLFGKEEGDKLCFAICQARGDKWKNWLIEVIKNAGIKPLVMSPEEHDRIMGVVQAVNHFSTFALALCIKESGFSFESLMECSTPAFQKRLDRIKSLLEQPPELFGSLMIDNIYAKNAIKSYQNSSEKLFEILSQTNRTKFNEIFVTLKNEFRLGKNE